ncbi:MAG: hypothetical protein IPM00_16880 [Tetrasphaera sp.]|nr:hypothetical protein [Tetrasphaera sp.]
MPVTINLPKLRLPDAYPLLTSVTKPWDEHELAELGERLGGVRLEREGLWHTGRSDLHLVEVYAASRSFRLELLASDELDGAADVGVEPDKARAIAEDFLAPFRPDGGDLTLRDISDAIVLVSESPKADPRRFVTATEVSFGFSRGHIGFVGPGAKARVSVRPDGNVTAAYRFWRDVEERGSVPARSADEIAQAFGASPTFGRLTDDLVKVEITAAEAGLFALPPTEVQDVFHPALELRGTLTTEDSSVGFCTYVSAVDPRRMVRERHEARRRSPAPPELVA